MRRDSSSQPLPERPHFSGSGGQGGGPPPQSSYDPISPVPLKPNQSSFPIQNCITKRGSCKKVISYVTQSCKYTLQYGSLLVWLVGLRWSLSSSGYPRTHFVVQAGLQLTISLPEPFMCWDDKCVPLKLLLKLCCLTLFANLVGFTIPMETDLWAHP